MLFLLAMVGMQTTPWPPESIAAAAAIKARNLELRARPAERGCLGHDALTCIASMGFYVYISSTPPGLGGYGELKLPKPVEHDIHGRPVPQHVTFLVTFSPGVTAITPPEAITAELALDDGEHVNRIVFTLPAAPISAKTQTDWDATRVFELSTAAMGAQCVGPDRLSFYRRYDAMQRRSSSGESVSSDYSNPGIGSALYGHDKICGATMEAVAGSGISVETGSYSISTLTFWVP